MSTPESLAARRIYSRRWRLKNKEKTRASSRRWYLKNKKKAYQQALEWRRRNRKTVSSWNVKWANKKYAADSVFRLKTLARSSIWRALNKNGWKKTNPMMKYLGCTIQELKQHIQSQFTDGMSWELKGKIHIDHRIPLASAKTKTEVIALLHYTNLQPLWEKDNRQKWCHLNYFN